MRILLTCVETSQSPGFEVDPVSPLIIEQHIYYERFSEGPCEVSKIARILSQKGQDKFQRGHTFSLFTRRLAHRSGHLDRMGIRPVN